MKLAPTESNSFENNPEGYISRFSATNFNDPKVIEAIKPKINDPLESRKPDGELSYPKTIVPGTFLAFLKKLQEHLAGLSEEDRAKAVATLVNIRQKIAKGEAISGEEFEMALSLDLHHFADIKMEEQIIPKDLTGFDLRCAYFKKMIMKGVQVCHLEGAIIEDSTIEGSIVRSPVGAIRNSTVKAIKDSAVDIIKDSTIEGSIVNSSIDSIGNSTVDTMKNNTVQTMDTVRAKSIKNNTVQETFIDVTAESIANNHLPQIIYRPKADDSERKGIIINNTVDGEMSGARVRMIASNKMGKGISNCEADVISFNTSTSMENVHAQTVANNRAQEIMHVVAENDFSGNIAEEMADISAKTIKGNIVFKFYKELLEMMGGDMDLVRQVIITMNETGGIGDDQKELMEKIAELELEYLGLMQNCRAETITGNVAGEMLDFVAKENISNNYVTEQFRDNSATNIAGNAVPRIINCVAKEIQGNYKNELGFPKLEAYELIGNQKPDDTMFDPKDLAQQNKGTESIDNEPPPSYGIGTILALSEKGEGLLDDLLRSDPNLSEIVRDHLATVMPSLKNIILLKWLREVLSDLEQLELANNTEQNDSKAIYQVAQSDMQQALTPKREQMAGGVHGFNTTTLRLISNDATASLQAVLGEVIIKKIPDISDFITQYLYEAQTKDKAQKEKSAQKRALLENKIINDLKTKWFKANPENPEAEKDFEDKLRQILSTLAKIVLQSDLPVQTEATDYVLTKIMGTNQEAVPKEPEIKTL